MANICVIRSKMEWLNAKRHQFLSTSKPYTADDLQATLKKEMKRHDWNSGNPYVVDLSARMYPAEVCDWCVVWVRGCTYNGKGFFATNVLGGANNEKRTITITLKG